MLALMHFPLEYRAEMLGAETRGQQTGVRGMPVIGQTFPGNPAGATPDCLPPVMRW